MRRSHQTLWFALFLGCGSHDGHGDPPPVMDVDPMEAEWSLKPFADRNADPGVIEVDLEARAGEVEYLNGKKTAVWTYNGTIPGPLLEGRVGDEVIVHFTNRLPEPTTIHWHGLRLPAAMDGTPAAQTPVPSGGTFEYRFKLADAGTFWYHPHVRSDDQVERGLYGAIVVRGDSEPDVGPERVVVLDDILLKADGSLAPPAGALEAMIGRQGNVMLANGRPRPVATVRAGQRQRWRLVNAANARYFRLSLAGHRFTILGVDGGLLEAPREVDEFMLTPGERVDLVLTPSGQPGAVVDLQSLPYERGHDTGLADPVNVIQVRYAMDAAVDPRAVPASLRTIQALPAPTVTRTFRLSEMEEGGGGHGAGEPTFLINGKSHPDVPLITGKLGDTETWEVINEAPMDHPFHLHGFFFQVLERGGQPAPYRAWKDTVNIPAMTTVKLGVRLDGFAGRWMYHCHILEHAERGMMGELEVAP